MREDNRPTVVALVEPDAPDPPGLHLVAGSAEVQVARDADELRRGLAIAEVLIVYDFRTTLLPAAIPHAQHLRWVHAASAGVDAVMVPEVVERDDLLVTNSRGVFDDAIAEYVLGAMLMFAKDTRRSVELQREHRWLHRESERLAGRRLLVVGAGSIGRAIARLARAAGLEVNGVARSERADDPDFSRIAPNEELHAQLGDADFVVLAVPLTDTTRHMIAANEFAAMRPGTRLINIARGAVVDEPALIRALQSGRLAGAALDVFEHEPLPAESPLWDMEQVLITPHHAGDVVGWVEALSRLFAENLERWRRGEDLVNVMQAPSARGGIDGR